MNTTDYRRPRKATRSREEEPKGKRKNPALGTTPPPRLQEMSWGEELGKEARWKKGTERREKEIHQTPYCPLPMISSRTGCSPSQVKTCFLREKKKKKTSTFSLFSWLEAGANPADIYTRAQPCMRTG